MSYANNKGAESVCASAQSDQQLFCFVRCLDSTKPLVSMYEIASLEIATLAAQATLNLTWSETPEDTFSHDGVHVFILCTFTYGQMIHLLIKNIVSSILRQRIHVHVCGCVYVYGNYQNTKTNREGILIRIHVRLCMIFKCPGIVCRKTHDVLDYLLYRDKLPNVYNTF